MIAAVVRLAWEMGRISNKTEKNPNAQANHHSFVSSYFISSNNDHNLKTGIRSANFAIP